MAAVLNLAANSVCLLLLSRWLFDSAWPDIIVAVFLLAVFSRSAARVLGRAWRELKTANAQPSCESAHS